MGWKINGIFDENIKKCVIAVMPHTCNFDFFIGLLVRGIVDQNEFFWKKRAFYFSVWILF